MKVKIELDHLDAMLLVLFISEKLKGEKTMITESGLDTIHNVAQNVLDQVAKTVKGKL